MNIPFFSSIFKKKTKTLKILDSIIIKNLKKVALENNLFLYESITIYHHTQSFYIPLLLLDPQRGISIFEHKPWSYDELKNATVSKAQNQDSSSKSIAFDKAHDFMRQKFNELTHTDGVDIFNFVLMENLNAKEYEHLDISFQELLPQNRVIFNDSSEKEILDKLQEVVQESSTLPDISNIMGNLLIQYLILSKENSVHLATNEQMHFINSDIIDFQTLSAKSASGKTSALLLKVILEKLKNPALSVIIISPTTLSCDILKQKLLNTIEYAIIEVDITSIEIITPLDLLNRHLAKLKRPPLQTLEFIDKQLMTHHFASAHLLMCDDSDVLPENFIDYLKHAQKKSNLLLVSSKNHDEATYKFETSFREARQQMIFIKANPHAKALQIISHILQENPSNEILLICNHINKIKLNDDLEFFIEDKALLLDSTKHLVEQNLETLLLASYEEISSLNAKFVLLLDAQEASKEQLDYASSLCEESCYVLYEHESENIQYLKDKTHLVG